jgi:hypothetical protein
MKGSLILVMALAAAWNSGAHGSALSESEFLERLRALAMPEYRSDGVAPSRTDQAKADSGAGVRLLSLPQPSVSTFGVPTGFGLPHGSAFLGGAGTDRGSRGPGGDVDASAAMGVGFGDAKRLVGADVTVGIISTNPTDGGFAADGNLNVRLFRQLPGLVDSGVSGIAVGVSNLAPWGEAQKVDRNEFISASTLINAQHWGGANVPLMFTAGYGTAVKNASRDPAGFGGVGVGLSPMFSASVSWAGDELMAGIGIQPVPGSNAQLTLGMGDITDRVNSRRWIITASWLIEDLF